MGCPCLLPSHADKTAQLLLIAGSVQTARRRLQPGFSPNFSPPGLLLTLPHQLAAAGQILLHHRSVTLRLPGLLNLSPVLVQEHFCTGGLLASPRGQSFGWRGRNGWHCKPQNVLWGTNAGGSRWTSGGTWVRMTWETAHGCPAGCSGTPPASCRGCGEGHGEAGAALAQSLKSCWSRKSWITGHYGW